MTDALTVEEFNSISSVTTAKSKVTTTLLKLGSSTYCVSGQFPKQQVTLTQDQLTNVSFYAAQTKAACGDFCGQLEGQSCFYTRDVFLFSCLLSLATFLLSFKLKGFKFTSYFPTKVRAVISDFGVTAAILIMITIDYLVGIDTPKLMVPEKFEPTTPRNWAVPLFGTEEEPLSTKIILLAVIPAIPATILVFLDQ